MTYLMHQQPIHWAYIAAHWIGDIYPVVVLELIVVETEYVNIQLLNESAIHPIFAM